MGEDNISGIVLDISKEVLDNIKDADKAIKDLESTSRRAATKIKGHFDNTMVSGVNAFIKKVRDAQGKLDSVKMPTLDASGLSAAIAAISQSMTTIDKSANTGAKRLTRISDAIAALKNANPDPQLFQNVADGINKIGNTSQQTIQNVHQLAATMAQLARDIRTVQQAQQAQTANTATAAQYNKLYKEQAILLRDIMTLENKPSKKASEIDLLDKMKQRYAEIYAQITELDKKQQTAASNLAKAQGQMRSRIVANTVNPTGAIAYAKEAKSLNELQAAYKNLKAVMATTKPDTEEWRQMNTQLEKTRGKIDDIRKKMGEFSQTAKGAGDIAGQLTRTLAAVFSVSAIRGYINKMIEVRAQFELQQTALRAILQNKDEADRIFMQVQQLALQSPFSIMQMTNYTKQLAAYRIESEKLVGTTKMLADVSAGLGVDMGRLILAYGQVKAANYLRATEVRQFTEAGLNIAGELANYFSELQGKMISVGDVMDMITKRMVRFEDVEEVFRRVTSADGLFYDMQKRQSETLLGQLQRIKDAMSIMFNEIGQSNQSTISWFLTTIRAIIRDWRSLAEVINSAGAAMAGFFAAKALRTFIAYWPTLISNVKLYASTIAQAVKNVSNLKAALSMLSATGWGALIAGVSLLVVGIWQAVTATSALQESLSRISEDSMGDMYDSIYKFKELADVIRDVNKSYSERTEALEELNRIYKDILPAEMLQIDNIKTMKNGYAEATDAIRDYYTEAAKKKAMETIAAEQDKQWNTLIDRLKDGAEYLKEGQDELAEVPVAALRGLIGKTMLELKREIEDGTTDVKDAWERFKVLFADASGVTLVDNSATRSFRAFFGEFTFTVADFYTDITDIVKEGNDSQREFDTQFADGFSQRTQNLIKLYKERQEAIERFYLALENYSKVQQSGELYNEQGSLTPKGRDVTQELNAAKAGVNEYLKELGEVQLSWTNVTTATENNTDVMLLFDGVRRKVLGGFLTQAQEIAKDTSGQAWVQRTRRELERLGLSDLQMDIIDIARQSATAHGMQIQMLDKLKISAETNYTSAAKDAKALSEQATDNVKKIQATKLALIDMARKAGTSMTDAEAQLRAESMHGNGSTQSELEEMAKFWTNLAKAYGDYDKKQSKGRQKDIWSPRLALMEKVNKEYEKLLKYYSKEESMAKVRSSYADAVAEAFQGTEWADISKWGTFDAQATVDRLKRLAEIAGKDAKKKILESAGTIEAELGIKVKERDIQNAKDEIQRAFDNYELTKTLGSLGLNVDLTYMVGGKPTTLSQVREDVENKLTTAKSTQGQEELVKAYEDYLRKIADLENKASIERLKNYYKYLTESMGARAQIEIKAIQDENKIREDANLDQFSKEQALMERRRKMHEELNKFDLDQLKSSDVYVTVFKDLEKASKEQLQYVINRLKQLQSAFTDLSPAQVKSIANDLKKMEDAIADKGATSQIFSSLKESIEYYRQRNDLLAEQANLQSKVDANEKALSDAQEYLFQLQMKLNGISDKLSDDWEDANDAVTSQQSLVQSLQNRIAELQAELDKVTGKINDGESAWTRWTKGIGNIRNNINQVKDSFDSLFTGLDSMGLVGDAFGDTYESVSEILGGVDTFMSGLESIDYTKPFSIITGGLKAIGGIAQTIGGFFGLGDKKKERQIQRIQEKVEDLQKAYEKLGKAIENTYTYNDYNMAYDQSMKNLEEQRQAIEEQMALEQAKKKTDKDRLKEYEEALESLAEKEKQLREDRYEAMGSITDSGVLSEAENFVSAWLDAYKETGDGLDALSEHWDEFFENLVMKQAASAIVSARMKKYIDRINQAIDEGDTGLSLSQTFAQIGQDLKNELGIWNEDLKAFFDAVGIKGGTGSLLLSDLQKGIQNITEPQAAAIEAYLNSMRFAVFEQNNILTSIMEAIQAQYGSSGDNPLLSEVKAIRSLVASIDDRLSRVIVPRNSAMTSYVVKVS